MLSTHSLARLAAIGGVFLLAMLPVSFFSILTVITLTHYFIALVYSRRQVAGAMASVSRAVPAIVAVAIGLGVQRLAVPLLFFFGVHHVFTEVYLLQREIHGGRSAETARLRIWSILFNYVMYLAVLHASPGNFPLPILLAGLAMTAVGYTAALVRLRHTLSMRALADTCAIEILSVVLLALSFRIQIEVTHFVAYHVLFWAVYPVPKLLRAGQALPFAGWHAATVPAFWLCSPWGPLPMSEVAWERLFFLASYVHISISFALSSSQPAWLNRLFAVPIHGQPERSAHQTAAGLARPVALVDE